ncbi:MAG: hypothetical protein RRA15_07575 [bacterium]|nr:hypothetical protein [bacterium]MDT8366336.1 hypothetical protein [bacterium]
MYRLASIIVLAVLLVLSVGLVQGKDAAPALKLEKDCVVFGRMDGHIIKMETGTSQRMTRIWFPDSLEMRGFTIVNLFSGMERKLELTKKGYFCINLDPGSYELRTLGSSGNLIVIDSFEVPHGRMVNLGTYRVEMKSASDLNDWVWHPCTIGPFTRTVRFNHMGDVGSYDGCEEWFASCNEAVYEKFASLPLRY